MKEYLKNGGLRELGLGGILVVLVLQLVLPYVTGSAAVQKSDIVPIENKLDRANDMLRDLQELNKQQCRSDATLQTLNAKEIEALRDLAYACETVIKLAEKMERRVDQEHAAKEGGGR